MFMRFGGSRSQPQWVQVGLGLAIIAATYLFLILVRAPDFVADANFNIPSVQQSTTALIALAGYLLGAGLIIWGAAQQFTTSTYVLIPIAIAINITIGHIWQVFLKMPVLYLDSIGTVLVAVLVGPWAAAATGGLSNIIWGLFNPGALPFAVAAIVIGLLAGMAAKIGWFRKAYLVPVAGFLTGIVAALVSAPIAAYLFGGVTGSGTDAIVAIFRAYGNSLLASTTLQGLVGDPLDKLLSFLTAYLIVVALPSRIRARFGQTGANNRPR
jgi:energy-coupling factor transport system substrate-specific component